MFTTNGRQGPRAESIYSSSHVGKERTSAKETGWEFPDVLFLETVARKYYTSGPEFQRSFRDLRSDRNVLVPRRVPEDVDKIAILLSRFRNEYREND